MNRFITLPNDRHVSVTTYIKAWRILKDLPPNQPVKGFSIHQTTASEVLQTIRRGVHDRINRHLTHHTGRDSIQDLRSDRYIIEDAIHRRTFRSGRNILNSHYLRKRYPEFNNRTA